MRNSPGIIATPAHERGGWRDGRGGRLRVPDMTEDDDLVEFTPEDGAGAL